MPPSLLPTHPVYLSHHVPTHHVPTHPVYLSHHVPAPSCLPAQPPRPCVAPLWPPGITCCSRPSSSLTAMRSAWKVLVAGCMPLPLRLLPPLLLPRICVCPMACTSCCVVLMGAASRAATILQDTHHRWLCHVPSESCVDDGYMSCSPGMLSLLQVLCRSCPRAYER
jgi:hypothetical protein